jgi:flagellar basal body-associated protein FliL
MADEEQAQEATANETAEGADQAARPPARAASGLNTVVVIVVGLVVMIVTPVLSFLVNSRMMPKPVASDLKAPEPGQQGIFKMDEIRVNILGTKATRYAIMTLHLVLSEVALQEEMTALKPMLADRVSTVVSRRTLEELEGPEARVSLKRDIMNEINAAIRDRVKGAVIDVYLSEYIIQ